MFFGPDRFRAKYWRLPRPGRPLTPSKLHFAVFACINANARRARTTSLDASVPGSSSSWTSTIVANVVCSHLLPPLYRCTEDRKTLATLPPGSQGNGTDTGANSGRNRYDDTRHYYATQQYWTLHHPPEQMLTSGYARLGARSSA